LDSKGLKALKVHLDQQVLKDLQEPLVSKAVLVLQALLVPPDLTVSLAPLETLGRREI